jgi:hypothetical protein
LHTASLMIPMNLSCPLENEGKVLNASSAGFGCAKSGGRPAARKQKL